MGLWDEGAEFLLGAISESKCLEPLVESAEVADRLNLVDIAQPVEKIAVPVTHVFDIPETGMVTLGELMRGTPPELHTQLLQQVWDSRPGVPVGSWMRLIHPEDTTTFLEAEIDSIRTFRKPLIIWCRRVTYVLPLRNRRRSISRPGNAPWKQSSGKRFSRMGQQSIRRWRDCRRFTIFESGRLLLAA